MIYETIWAQLRLLVKCQSQHWTRFPTVPPQTQRLSALPVVEAYLPRDNRVGHKSSRSLVVDTRGTTRAAAAPGIVVGRRRH